MTAVEVRSDRMLMLTGKYFDPEEPEEPNDNVPVDGEPYNVYAV